MRFAGLMLNDISDGIDGISVSLWTQGCPHRCVGCHNPQTWDFDGGEKVPDNINEIADLLTDGNIVFKVEDNKIKYSLEPGQCCFFAW